MSDIDTGVEQLSRLVMSCALAIMSGSKTVTLSVRGMRPEGFPRGALLSVGTDGSKNYAVCPVKALAWLHARTSKRATTSSSEAREG